MRFSDENLRGRVVIGADGQVIGEVSSLFLEGDTWRVEALQLKLDRKIADQLGISRGLFHSPLIEIPSRMVQSVGDTLVLSVSVDGLRQVVPSDAEPLSSH